MVVNIKTEHQSIPGQLNIIKEVRIPCVSVITTNSNRGFFSAFNKIALVYV